MSTNCVPSASPMPESSSLRDPRIGLSARLEQTLLMNGASWGSRPNARFGILDCYNRYEVIFSAFLLPEIGVYFAKIANIFAADLVFLRIAPIFAVYLVVQAILDPNEYGARRDVGSTTCRCPDEGSPDLTPA